MGQECHTVEQNIRMLAKVPSRLSRSGAKASQEKRSEKFPGQRGARPPGANLLRLWPSRVVPANAGIQSLQ